MTDSLNSPWSGRSSVWIPQWRWYTHTSYKQFASSRDSFAPWKILDRGANCLRMKLTWQIRVKGKLETGFICLGTKIET